MSSKYYLRLINGLLKKKKKALTGMGLGVLNGTLGHYSVLVDWLHWFRCMKEADQYRGFQSL